MAATLEQLIRVRSQVAEELIPYLKRVESALRQHGLLDTWGDQLANFSSHVRLAADAAERLAQSEVAPAEICFLAYVHLRDVAKALRKEDRLQAFLVETKCPIAVALTDSDYFIAAILMVLKRRFSLSDSLVRYGWDKIREPCAAEAKVRLLLFLEGWGEVLGGNEPLAHHLNHLAKQPAVELFYIPPPLEGSPWNSFLYWLRTMRRLLESWLNRVRLSVQSRPLVYALACLLLAMVMTAIWFVSDRPKPSRIDWKHHNQGNNRVLLSAEVEHRSTFLPGVWLWLATKIQNGKYLLVIGECQEAIDGTPFRMQCPVGKYIFEAGGVTLQILRPKGTIEGAFRSKSVEGVSEEFVLLYSETLTP